MYVSADVRGMATVLPVLEPHVQSHYFLDTPRRLLNGRTVEVFWVFW